MAETQGTNVNDVEKDKGSIEVVAETVRTKVNDLEKNKDNLKMKKKIQGQT